MFLFIIEKQVHSLWFSIKTHRGKILFYINRSKQEINHWCIVSVDDRHAWTHFQLEALKGTDGGDANSEITEEHISNCLSSCKRLTEVIVLRH